MRIKDRKLTAMQSLEILRGLGPRQLRSLAPRADEVTVGAGEVLIRQGQLNRHAYLIVSGSVGVDVDGQEVAVVTAGSIVGERTAVHRGFTNATVTALEPTTVLAIDHQALLGAATDAREFEAQLRSLADARTNVAA